MKVVSYTFSQFNAMNASELHMLTTGEAGATDTSFAHLKYDRYADGADSAAGGTIVCKTVVPEEPYTVKLAQYVKVGTTVVIRFLTTYAGDIEDTMNQICSYWEYVKAGSTTIAFGVSRVQKTDFDDPMSAIAATGLESFIYESPKQLNYSERVGQGAIVGVDQRIGGVSNFSLAKPMGATMIGGSNKPSK